MKKLSKAGIIPRKLEKVKPPICVACLKGKQHKTPWKGRGKNHSSIRKPHDNFPGAQTSTDQMISPYGGMIPQMKGRLTKAKFYGATVFVDHWTDFTYVHLMRDTTAEATLEAKNAYEALLLSNGHKVLAYHADNGRYAEKAFRLDTKDKAQRMSYCGVGSHHQNGIAERRIKSLCEDARTMLAHGMHIWPQVITKSLWPFALKAACRARNKFNIDSEYLSPEMKLARVQTSPELRNEHPLFCPVFTLDKSLQSGTGMLPKWNPRSNVGVYLGHSPDHASNVALVLNLTTGLVSPQYHVVFDDNFSTVGYIHNSKEPTHWEDLCKHHTEDFHMIPTETAKINDMVHEISWIDDIVRDDVNQKNSSETASQFSPTHTTAREGDSTENIPSVRVDDDEESVRSSAVEEEDEAIERNGPEINQASEGVRKSSRHRKPTIKLANSENKHMSKLRSGVGLMVALATSIQTPKRVYSKVKKTLHGKVQEHAERLMLYEETLEMNVDGSLNFIHPLSLAVSSGQNDTFHFHDAMQQPDREEFIKAMIKELKDHHDNQHWRLVRRSDIGNARTVKAIWAFKRKRRPDGSLLKHKARLNAHGGMQVYGESYWDTYAPVVNWISIRMMLTLSVIHSLYTTSIDFTLAFPQADVDATIYMEIPLGCQAPEGDYVCLLLKNLYGLKQAAKTWFEHLRDTLMADASKGGHGFKQSSIDPCVFYKEGIILISWVDDCLIFAKDKQRADELIKDLQRSFTLTEEDDVSAYLGVEVNIDKVSDTISLTQPYLIQRIIDALGTSISEANTKSTPAVYKEILHRDED